jgi:hypothetical protein
LDSSFRGEARVKKKPPRFIVLHEGVLARFPWTVIESDNGEPALWHNDPKVGKVPRRFRTQALAQAAADQLIAGEKKK